MPSPQEPQGIDADASVWAVRLDSGAPLDRKAQDDLDDWLAHNPRNTGALLRAQAALSLLDRGRALNGAASRHQKDPTAIKGPSLYRRRFLQSGAAIGAASLVGGGVAVSLSGKRYNTTLGEVRRIPLSDGSLVTINTRSSVRVRMQSHERSVHLDRGEVWFEVAKDADRPFVVAAGDARVRAVGTAFSVKQDDAWAQVMVTEGVVEVWNADQPTLRRRLSAGATARLQSGHPLQTTEESLHTIDTKLAWRDGHIVLNGQTLSEAAAEFNRYNARQIVIDDPSLRAERFVGLFQSNDPQSFASAVAMTLNATIVQDDSAIHLRRL